MVALNIKPKIMINKKQLFPKYNNLPFPLGKKLWLCKLGSAFALHNSQLQSLNNASSVQRPWNWFLWCLTTTLDCRQQPQATWGIAEKWGKHDGIVLFAKMECGID